MINYAYWPLFLEPIDLYCDRSGDFEKRKPLCSKFALSNLFYANWSNRIYDYHTNKVWSNRWWILWYLLECENVIERGEIFYERCINVCRLLCYALSWRIFFHRKSIWIFFTRLYWQIYWTFWLKMHVNHYHNFRLKMHVNRNQLNS